MMMPFHFLRPSWLLAIPVVVLLLFMAWRRASSAGNWARICEPHLLRHLVDGGDASVRRWPLALLAVAGLSSALALAGPTWQRLPQATFENPARSVLVVGLSPSMDARDVAPSRLARARHKLQDAVEILSGGSVALVVYGEEAFAATPLTDDAQVLRELLPLLETDLVPGRTVHPARGLREASLLLAPLGVPGARVLLVSDGSDDDPGATTRAAADLARAGASVSVLGITAETTALRAVAEAGGGHFAALSADNTDLSALLSDESIPLGSPLRRTEIRTDAWRDMGVFLLWVPVLLAPWAFRKGWATALLALLVIQLPTSSAEAAMRDWFERPDQQGARAFAEGEYTASAESFEDPAWQADARYKAGDFDAAAALLAGRSDTLSQYNLGNALAKGGRLEEALAAYGAVLAAEPSQEDAAFNRDLVKQLLDSQPPPNSTPPEDGDASSESGANGEASAAADPNADSKQQDASDDASGQQGTGHAATASEPSLPEHAKEAAGNSDAATADSGAADAATASNAHKNTGDAAAPANSSADTADETGAAGQSPPMASASPTPERHGAERTGGGTTNGDVPDAAADRDGAAGVPRATAPDDQATAQWLARLPDDPGGLLREKIRRDYVRKLQAREQGDLR